jgi:diaminohydroxyphosphoribosylaminopyrimidine deaminase/5-amino-6-(5-phosphoribosylamino)uracil reductase
MTWARTGRPFVTVKLALSLDARIACRNGDARWITGLAARRKAHGLRRLHDAVVVGRKTVVADNPELTVRLVHGSSPARIVLDSSLSSSPQARWLAADGPRRIVVASKAAPTMAYRAFSNAGAEIWLLPRSLRGGLDLAAFLDKAAASGFRSLMIEGGGNLASSFLAAGFVNRIEFFYAPIFLGAGAPDFTQSLMVKRIALAPRLRNVRLRRLGEDWQVSAEL